MNKLNPTGCYTQTIHTNLYFFNTPAPPQIYTLSLHDALPISKAMKHGKLTLQHLARFRAEARKHSGALGVHSPMRSEEHTSELQSLTISYAVFCLKKKKGQFRILVIDKRNGMTKAYDSLRCIW